jgi:hypothetical protein
MPCLPTVKLIFAMFAGQTKRLMPFDGYSSEE